MPTMAEPEDMFSSVTDAIRRLLGDGRPEVTRATDTFPAEGYRTTLEYWWDEALPALIVIGQNPSKATRRRGDPTVTRCARRAHAMGLGGLIMLNLFPVVATDPADMWSQATDDRRQADNMATIAATLRGYPTSPILFAPGGDREPRHAIATRAVEELVANHGRTMLCLGTTATGAPRHPSRCGYAIEAVPWIRPDGVST